VAFFDIIVQRVHSAYRAN